ncbi:HNH endonuclease signature motif containing protein, partial [Blastococcus sp. TF02A-26]|uniref:HNH endonuclease signature motif containing protein n=1 Tax=Blastococcus sp. TF02A-26 TaxID=2250577 RepID=UPI000E16B3D6
PVRVLLTLIASVDTLTGTGADADEPAELDGETVPAALVRELAYTLGLLPRPATPAGPADTTAPVEAVPTDDVQAGDPHTGSPAADRVEASPIVSQSESDAAGHTAGTTAEVGSLAALLDLRRLTDTALAERPRIALVEQISGCLLALTDSIELRAAARDGTGLGPPPETDGYRPSAPLDRFVRLRDRRCRFPGCRARARRGDLDHRVPHPLGPTAHHNLEGLCEHHHRLSHQAPGWKLGGSSDGGLVWTLPGGVTITTVPPRFGTDDGSQPAATVPTATTGGGGDGTTADPDGLAWHRLTPGQRREQIRRRVCGRAARTGDPPAPF